jgi:hypothetical protein
VAAPIARSQVQSGNGSYFQFLAPPPTLNDLAGAVPAMALVEVLTSQRRELTVRAGSPSEIVEHQMRVIEVLKDEDYLASLAKVAPEEADTMLAGWGVTRADLAGAVHSITWRAFKR